MSPLHQGSTRKKTSPCSRRSLVGSMCTSRGAIPVLCRRSRRTAQHFSRRSGRSCAGFPTARQQRTAGSPRILPPHAAGGCQHRPSAVRSEPDLHPHSLSPRHRYRWQPHGLCRRARQEGSAATAGGRTIGFLCATARRTSSIRSYSFSASLCSRDAFACWAIASQTQPPVGMVTPRLRALCAS